MAKGRVLDLDEFDESIENSFSLKDVEKKNPGNGVGEDVINSDKVIAPVKTAKIPLKRNLKAYELIFDNSLENYKNAKVTAALYKINSDRINILSNLLPNKGKADLLNYIVQNFFKENQKEIIKAHKAYLQTIDKDPLNL